MIKSTIDSSDIAKLANLFPTAPAPAGCPESDFSITALLAKMPFKGSKLITALPTASGEFVDIEIDVVS